MKKIFTTESAENAEMDSIQKTKEDQVKSVLNFFVFLFRYFSAVSACSAVKDWERKIWLMQKNGL
jgi:hypothetical protein